MATRSSRKKKEEEEEEVFLTPTADELDQEEFFGELGAGSAAVSVYRVVDGKCNFKKRVEWADLRENPLELIRKRFGIGTFELRFRASDGTFRGSKRVHIEGEGPEGSPAGLPGSSPNGDSTFMRDVLLALIAKQAPAPAPAIDLGALFTGMAALMGSTRVPAAPDSPAAMLSAVVGAFSTLKGATGPAKDEDWLVRAKTIIELAKDLQPENNQKEDTIWSVVKDVGKEVVGRISAGGLLPPAPIHAVEAIRVPTPGQTEQQPPNQERTAEDLRQMQLKQAAQVAEFLKQALAIMKRDALRDNPQMELADLCIDWIVNHEQEPQWAAILGAIGQGAQFEHLLQFDPEIAQNPHLTAWFRKVYDGLHADIFEQVDSTGTGGHTADAGGNAPPGLNGQPGAGDPKSS